LNSCEVVRSNPPIIKIETAPDGEKFSPWWDVRHPDEHVSQITRTRNELRASDLGGALREVLAVNEDHPPVFFRHTKTRQSRSARRRVAQKRTARLRREVGRELLSPLQIGCKWSCEKWSGRVDSNHRPLGPEPSVNATISECFRRSLDSGRNWVAILAHPVTRIRRTRPPMFVAPRPVDESVRAGLSACGPLARPASHPRVPS
jgi:hypothetical protein